MNGIDQFLSWLNLIIDGYSFAGIRFLWLSSILVIAAWGMCRIVKNDSHQVKSTLWTAVILAIPFLLLISSTIATIYVWEITIDLDSGFFKEKVSPETTENIIVSGQTALQPIVTEKPVAQSSINLMEYKWAILFLAYCLGFLAMFFIFVVKILRVYRWRKKGHLITDFSINTNLLRLKNSIGIDRTIKAYRSDEITVPIVSGIFTPAILLPSTLLYRFDKKIIDVVLAHECAHIARKDNLILLFASLMRTVLFFHPLIWFAVNRLSLSVEKAADCAVMKKTAIDARNYASVLFGLAAANLTPAAALPFSRNHNLLARITSILDSTKKTPEEFTMNRFKKYFFITIISAIFVSSLMVGFNCGVRQTAQGTQKSERQADTFMTVYGRVIDPDGKPVSGIPVDATREIPAPYNFGNSLTGDCRYMVFTDTDGIFRIPFPNKYKSGRKNIHFKKLVRKGASRDGGVVLVAHAGNKWNHAPDHRWLTDLANGISNPIKLKKGETGPVTIQLTKGATISGTVFDGEDRPVSGREVKVAYKNGQYNRYYRPTAVTDEEGSFTITNVRQGKVLVIATEVVLTVYDGTSPYPENTTVTLDVKENSIIDGLRLRGLTVVEIVALHKSAKAKSLKRAYGIW